jgi:hypothetical protein
MGECSTEPWWVRVRIFGWCEKFGVEKFILHVNLKEEIKYTLWMESW